jgi:hypothetical protein
LRGPVRIRSYSYGRLFGQSVETEIKRLRFIGRMGRQPVQGNQSESSALTAANMVDGSSDWPYLGNWGEQQPVPRGNTRILGALIVCIEDECGRDILDLV